MADNCVVCVRTLSRRCRRYILSERLLENRRDFIEIMLRDLDGEVPFDGSRSICHACRIRIDAVVNQNRQAALVPAPAPALDQALNIEGIRREDNNCVICERALRRHRRYTLNEALLENRRDLVAKMLRELDREVPFDGSRSICHACRLRIDAVVNQNRQAAPVPASAPAPAPVFVQELNIEGLRRAANTAGRCMVDNCVSRQLRQVPNSLKVHLLSYFNFFIPRLARICDRHFQQLSMEDIPINVTNEMNGLSGEHIVDIIRMYTLALEQKSFLNFEEIDEISDEDAHYWTGLNKENFCTLLNEIPSLRRVSQTPQIDLGVYLCKLRTGETNTRIATVFNL